VYAGGADDHGAMDGNCDGAALIALVVSACGGSSSPSGPSTPPVSNPPPSPPTTNPSPPPSSNEQWTVSGRVTATTSGRGLSGVRITSEAGATAVSDADGAYRIGSETNPATTRQKFTFSHPEFLSREVYITWQRGLRENIVIDLIPTAPPFSIGFFQALVRNGYELPGSLQPLRRWTTSPRFYVRSADQNGRAIEPEVMALVLGTIPRAVSDWTGGRLGVAVLESGPETRPEASGWIIVNITRDYSSNFCGRSRVGSDPGLITLVNDRCNCGSVKISGDVVVHEVGHALGFWHVNDRSAVMYPQDLGGCPAGTLSPAERFHAGLAYQRPVGSLDPDRDPTSSVFADDVPGIAPEVSCFIKRAG
jgi:hypothetical protein